MNGPSPITSRLVRQEDLTPFERDAMFRLLADHFHGVTMRQFARDLAEKNWALLFGRGECLAGFSTMLVSETCSEEGPISVVYSGDTIMAREAWGTTALPRAWIAAVNSLRASYPRGRYYWLLLTSGFRTYRFLPVFWREFFPRHDLAAPDASRRLLEHLARERFGDQYDASAGVVRFKLPQRLRGPLGEVPRGRTADPHIGFFLTRNPGHARGDELVCLTELSAANLTSAGRRMVGPMPRELSCHHC